MGVRCVITFQLTGYGKVAATVGWRGQSSLYIDIGNSHSRYFLALCYIYSTPQ